MCSPGGGQPSPETNLTYCPTHRQNSRFGRIEIEWPSTRTHSPHNPVGLYRQKMYTRYTTLRPSPGSLQEWRAGQLIHNHDGIHLAPLESEIRLSARPSFQVPWCKLYQVDRTMTYLYNWHTLWSPFLKSVTTTPVCLDFHAILKRSIHPSLNMYP